jgi:hypothetical protein
MVVDEVYHTPTTTTSTITLFTNKTFFSHHLFNEDGQSPIELFKGETLDQMLLKFAPLCSHGIHNFITSLKHCSSNSSSIDYIVKLKVLFGYDYI